MSEAFDPYRKWLGIPPDEQPPNHYRLLGIALYEDDHDVIHNAADRQMAHLRTFQSGRFAEHSQRLLNEVSSARLCLLNPSQKQAYDKALRARLAPPKAAAPLPPAGPPPAGPPVAPPPGMSIPPPVPPPAVSPVGTPVPVAAVDPTPLVRTSSRGRSAGYAARRKKKSPVTMIVVILLVGGLSIAGLLFVLFNGQKSNVVESSSPPSAAREQAKPPVTSPNRSPAPRPSSDTNPRPRAPMAVSPLPAEAAGNGRSSSPLENPPSVAEIEAQHVDTALAEVRMKLHQRELEAAQRTLSGLKELAERHDKAAEYEQLSMLRYYLHQFWSEGVRAAAHRHMMPGERFEFQGDSVELVAVDEATQEVTYKFNGTQAASLAREIPTQAALVFAWRSFDRENVDPYSYIFTAAFLAFDSASSIPEQQRLDQAKKFWQQAAEAGTREQYVAKELGITAEDAGTRDLLPPSTSEQPASQPSAVTDPPPF